ncbi:MAG TPA: hypothetical protein VL651_01935, partial [Bacteroidia bacterium]|nr:hypothetical protein [Bacteroidia bacterium]
EPNQDEVIHYEDSNSCSEFTIPSLRAGEETPMTLRFGFNSSTDQRTQLRKVVEFVYLTIQGDKLADTYLVTSTLGTGVRHTELKYIGKHYLGNNGYNRNIFG